MAGSGLVKDGFFSSVLADRLSDYVSLRRSLGFEFRSQLYVLRQFDRIARTEMTVSGPVTRGTVESFLRSLQRLMPTTRRLRFSIIRQFLLHLRQFEPDTFVPDRSLAPGRGSPRTPHVYTDDEIQALLQEAMRFPARYPGRRWLLHHTVFALLYVTGLRVSEALALNLGDVDLSGAVIHVRRTKFHKTRLVPLAPSTCEGLKPYLVARAERGCSTASEAPLFVNEKGGRLSYSSLRHAFRKIARRAGLSGPTGTRGVRIHDLRHTTAVRRLYLWYREGRDVQALLPALVTYLGHTSVRCTEVYLTTTAELLAEASARFEKHFNVEECP